MIAVSFLPVLALEAQKAACSPLAYTKNFAMVVAAVLAITLDPALRLFFFRRRTSGSRAFRQDHQRHLVGKIHSKRSIRSAAS